MTDETLNGYIEHYQTQTNNLLSRVLELETALAKYSCNCPYPCALYDAEKAKEATMPHMMCGWWSKSVLEKSDG